MCEGGDGCGAAATQAADESVMAEVRYPCGPPGRSSDRMWHRIPTNLRDHAGQRKTDRGTKCGKPLGLVAAPRLSSGRGDHGVHGAGHLCGADGGGCGGATGASGRHARPDRAGAVQSGSGAGGGTDLGERDAAGRLCDRCRCGFAPFRSARNAVRAVSGGPADGVAGGDAAGYAGSSVRDRGYGGGLLQLGGAAQATRSPGHFPAGAAA